MLTDPVIAWLIALLIATIFGVVMWRRGYDSGSAEAAQFLALAVINSKRMSAESLKNAVESEWERQNSPDDPEE